LFTHEASLASARQVDLHLRSAVCHLVLQVLMSSHALTALCTTLQLPHQLTNAPSAAPEAGESGRWRQQLRSVSVLPLLQLYFFALNVSGVQLGSAAAAASGWCCGTLDDS
jgi:hypothetical protein